ncbi:MAG: hypothetical protein R3D58_14860 [Saprospiraceae bacterium]
MKNVFFIAFCCLPFLSFGQVMDTAAVGREVDSLFLVAGSEIK